ncbi:DUF6065 family protein [Nitratireductor sp. XY-223]|uniref:DUF6065 family protein n=1 Tax=Nitratireductor sp. XY-223 TaxID=2561926 RepID=UPI0010AA9D88|nr:DUF6065 family protein [Nitratireductor sp. XY-223]
MFFRVDEPKIEFLCRPRDEGVIPVPVPAKSYLPDWFRRLKPITEAAASPTSSGLTVKRCMPFLDAMTTGWILPLAATVRLEIADGGTTVNSGWDFDREMVSGHGAHQIRGHPKSHLPPCKFHNYWTIRTPPGWSCLFVDPLNRPNGVFEVISGVVDTDTYVSEIHFPFLATGADGLHVIERGSPLVQVIPFRREAASLEADIRAETEGECADRERILRSTCAAPGWYRDNARARRA